MKTLIALSLTMILIVAAGGCGAAPSPTTTPEEPAPTPAPPTATPIPSDPTPTPIVETPVPLVETPAAPMKISSSAFEDEGEIPPRHAVCPDEANISPALSWSNVPPGTGSLALVCVDALGTYGHEGGVPESAVFVHWLIYNIPPTATSLPEGMPAEATLDDGTSQSRNDYGEVGYGGPCPPPGDTHLYFFTLYALDTDLNLPPEAERDALLQAMDGHILAQAELVGSYTW